MLFKIKLWIMKYILRRRIAIGYDVAGVGQYDRTVVTIFEVKKNKTMKLLKYYIL